MKRLAVVLAVVAIGALAWCATADSKRQQIADAEYEAMIGRVFDELPPARVTILAAGNETSIEREDLEDETEIPGVWAAVAIRSSGGNHLHFNRMAHWEPGPEEYVRVDANDYRPEFLRLKARLERSMPDGVRLLSLTRYESRPGRNYFPAEVEVSIWRYGYAHGRLAKGSARIVPLEELPGAITVLDVDAALVDRPRLEISFTRGGEVVHGAPPVSWKIDGDNPFCGAAESFPGITTIRVPPGRCMILPNYYELWPEDQPWSFTPKQVEIPDDPASLTKVTIELDLPIALLKLDASDRSGIRPDYSFFLRWNRRYRQHIDVDHIRGGTVPVIPDFGGPFVAALRIGGDKGHRVDLGHLQPGRVHHFEVRPGDN